MLYNSNIKVSVCSGIMCVHRLRFIILTMPVYNRCLKNNTNPVVCTEVG